MNPKTFYFDEKLSELNKKGFYSIKNMKKPFMNEQTLPAQ